MPELQPANSPLARLVLFMIFLSIAGSFVAGIHYYAVDLPLQNSVQAPANNDACDDVQNRACRKICLALGFNSHDAYLNCLKDNGCC
jgi:hypothetical protein